MPIKSILFGSIDTLAETADLQRLAYNDAFAEAGIELTWSEADYRHEFDTREGADPAARAAEAAGADAEALARRQAEIFRHKVSEIGLTPRPGVAEVMEAARGADIALAFVTTADQASVTELIGALELPLAPETFAFVGHRGLVKADKPDPEIYRRALYALEIDPTDAVAIEDTPEHAQAAIAAGIPTIAFPDHYHRHREFDGVIGRYDALSPGLFGL